MNMSRPTATDMQAVKKYHGVQILRFFAASLVVIEHALRDIVGSWPGYNTIIIPGFGEVGVYIFFGISGFIMLSTQYDSFGDAKNAGVFLRRRILRVLPIYFIATTLQYINKLNFGENYNLLNYLKSLLFIPYIGELGMFRPILGQGWTLNYEMFFYLVFALAIFFERSKGLAVVFASLIIFVLFGENFNIESDVIRFYTNRILIFFLIGIAVAILEKSLKRVEFSAALSTSGCLLLTCLGLLSCFVDSEAVRFCVYLLMVSCVVLLAVGCRFKNNSWLVALLGHLGDASYSTYLFHGFMLGALKFFSKKIHPGEYIEFVAFVIVSCVLANLVGWIFFKYLESPIARLIGNFEKKRKSMAASGGQAPVTMHKP